MATRVYQVAGEFARKTREHAGENFERAFHNQEEVLEWWDRTLDASIAEAEIVVLDELPITLDGEFNRKL
jgi:hypothetical protein